MKKIIYLLLLTTIFSCTNRNTVVDKDNLLGNDYRLFQNTPSWNLAKAVSDQDLFKIALLLKEEKTNIDYQEPKYGQTLLMLTVLNGQYKSCKKLLELGADPNKHDTYDGSSAIIEAADINGTEDDNTKFLSLLLKYKANCNDVEVGKRRKDNLGRMTPLLNSCSSINKIISPLAKVKVLVNAGANINFVSDLNTTALGKAMLTDNYDIVIYLLNQGAHYKIPILYRDEKPIYIENLLRESLLPLDSKNYKFKAQIIRTLNQKGANYKKTPVPDFIIKKIKKMYPENWQEYLNRY